MVMFICLLNFPLDLFLYQFLHQRSIQAFSIVGRETWRKEKRETDREKFVGREETRGSDSENMRREEMRELTQRERERERERGRPKKSVSLGYKGYKIR